MKSQGLPINFIVLAAVAILILILIVGFVIGGGTAFERGVSPGIARNNCNRWCYDLQVEASRIGESSIETNSNFCTNTQIVDGEPTTCNALNIQCILTFQDGQSRYASC